MKNIIEKNCKEGTERFKKELNELKRIALLYLIHNMLRSSQMKRYVSDILKIDSERQKCYIFEGNLN